MTLYSTEKLVSEARRLAAEYRRATGKPLGISSEIAEFDAAKILDLELLSKKPGGYDAIGRSGSREGKRIQIKGRVIFDPDKGGQRIGQLKTDQDWDSLVLVILDENYQPVELYEADREVVEDALDENISPGRRKRGAMSLGKFKHIAQRVWHRDAAESERDTGS